MANRICRSIPGCDVSRRQRLPGGRAPFAIPRPFTGGSVFSGCFAVALAGSSGAAADSPSVSGSGCGAAGFAAGWAGDFLAPGRRAPGAMPRPLTGGSGRLSASGPVRRGLFGSAAVDAGSRMAVAAGAFLAPGRLAPAAMPRPLTSGSALAGSAGAAASRRGAGFGRRRAGLLGAGTLGARRDTESLGGRCSGARASRPGAGAAGGLLRTGTLRAACDPEPGDRLAFRGGSGVGLGLPAWLPVPPRPSRPRPLPGPLHSCGAAFAAAPFSGSVTELLSSEPSSSCATSSTSAFAMSIGLRRRRRHRRSSSPGRTGSRSRSSTRPCPAPPRRVRG